MKDSTVIDMTPHGPVYDRDGYQDLLKNFMRVFLELSKMQPALKKRNKVEILISIVYGSENNPQRGCISRIITFGFLYRKFKLWESEGYIDLETYTEEVSSFYWSVWEKQAEKRSAWGLYSNIMHQQNKVKEAAAFEKSIERLPREEKEVRRRAFSSNNSCRILIG